MFKEYIENTLNLKVDLTPTDDYHLLGIDVNSTVVELYYGKILNKKFLLIIPRTTLKLFDLITVSNNVANNSGCNLETVFCFNIMFSRRIKDLYQSNLNYVVENRIIHLPFLVINHEEITHEGVLNYINNSELNDEANLLTSISSINPYTFSNNAQQIITYCLSCGKGQYPMKLIGDALDMNQWSVKVAFNEFDKLGLNITNYEYNGKRYLDLSNLSYKTINLILSYMKSPILRQYPLSSRKNMGVLPLSSFSALSFLTDNKFKYSKYLIYGYYKTSQGTIVSAMENKNTIHRTNVASPEIVIQELSYNCTFIEDDKGTKCIDPFTVISMIPPQKRNTPVMQQVIKYLIDKYYFKKF